MFIVQDKHNPSSYYMDKKSFDEITANCEHHAVDNVKVGMRLTAQTKVVSPSPETEPLGTPKMEDIDDTKGIVAAEPDYRPVSGGVMNRGKETPLGSPTLDFSDN